ncbi:MAG: glycosyl hydrolase [Gemmatimonadetes bacterium]|nr:glycosyl hydrolase [Gemmatimonadota bacterium]
MTAPRLRPDRGLAVALRLCLTAALACPAVALPAQGARSAATPAAAPAYDSALFGSLTYRMIGPFRGGRSTAVAGIAGEPFTFLQGGTGGGVWKTDDAGTSWKNITDGFFGGSIGAIDIADSDPNVIYVGTGSADIRGNSSQGRGVWKSLDAGRTWRFIGLPESGAIRRVVVHPANPDLVFVTALGHMFGKNRERGVYRSKDGGATWEQVLFLNDSTGASDLSMDPRNPRVLYAGMWRAERKPWTMLSGGPEGGVYKSVDGGDTWNKLGGGLPAGLVGKVGVSVSPANGDRVWAIIEAEPAGGVYRSDDAGKTWTRTNSENKLRQRAWYYTRIEADPEDENTVYALNTSIYRSIDGGKTFTPIEVPHGDTHDLWINPRDNRVMVLADDGGAQVTLNKGKSWTSMNNVPTAEFYDVAVDNGFPYRVYSAQQDNTSISIPAWSGPNVLHPMNEWRYAAGCETGPVALHPDHPEVMWGGCYGGAINRFDARTDQRRNVVIYPQLQLGQAAKDLKYRFQWVAPIVVSRHDPAVVYHASQYVHRTRDGGMTWETISPDLTTNTPAHQEAAGGPINHDVTGVEIFNTIFALSEDPRDARTLWAGSDDGRVHITRDGGASWQEITPPGMPRYGTVENIDLSAHRAGRAYVGVQRFRMDDFRPYIFRTDDYGRTWTLLTDGTNGIPAGSPVRAVREDPVRDGIVYAGTEHGVYVTFDAGRRWQSLQLNLPISPVADMRVHRNDLVVATQGRSLYILDDLTPLHQLAEVTRGAAAHLYTPRDAYRIQVGGGGAGGIENAPDPLPGGAMMHAWFAAAPDSTTRVDVLDARGVVVRSFTTDTARARESGQPALKRTAGAQRVMWDLTYPGPRVLKGQTIWGYTGGVKAPPGTYQVRLTAGALTQTRTFRLLADPRIPEVTQADYEEQFRVASALRDSMNVVNQSLELIRSVATQAKQAVELAGRIGRVADVTPAADELAAKLSGVEGALNQTKSESGQDPIRHAGKLDNQLVELYANVTGDDSYIYGGPEGRPTRGATERLGDVLREWAPLSAQLRTIIERDVPAFNELLRRLGLGAIVLPPRPVM